MFQSNEFDSVPVISLCSRSIYMRFIVIILEFVIWQDFMAQGAGIDGESINLSRVNSI